LKLDLPKYYISGKTYFEVESNVRLQNHPLAINLNSEKHNLVIFIYQTSDIRAYK